MDEKQKQVIRFGMGFLIGLIIVLIILLLFSSRRIGQLKQTERLYSISQDSLSTVKNELGEQTAKVEVLESEQVTLFTQLNVKDANINRLQNLVKKYEKENGDLRTAIIISNETVIKLRDSLRAVIVGYTPDPNTPTIMYPIYLRTFEKKWYNGTIVMGFDSLDLSIVVRNDYDITIGDEKVSLFKKKYYANITNLNPDTDTKVMKVYDKQEKKTHVLRNTGIAAGVGLVVGLLIH